MNFETVQALLDTPRCKEMNNAFAAYRKEEGDPIKDAFFSGVYWADTHASEKRLFADKTIKKIEAVVEKYIAEKPKMGFFHFFKQNFDYYSVKKQ